MEIVLRATVVFFLLFALTRGLKKRALAEMAPFEMILLVVLGDIVQQGVIQEDFSLTGSALAAGTFAFWVTAMTWSTWRSPRIRRIVDGVPIVVVQDGQPVEAALRLEQMPVDEIMEAARQQGIDDIEKIRLAVLEPSGKISILQAG